MADAVVVITAPGLGDGVQALKAGLLEIADVLVVNKGDREGADHALGDLRDDAADRRAPRLARRGAREGGHEDASEHQDQDEPVRPAPTLVRAVATTGEGTAELVRALEALRPLPAPEQARRRRRQDRGAGGRSRE